MRSRLGQWALVIRRVRADYRTFTGRTPSLLRPRRFTEKMQWRKLFELDPVFAILSDKLASRDFVAARIGPGRQPELLWVGTDPDGIPFDQLVPPYVLKSTHGSGHVIIVRDTAVLDAAAARATARGWLAHPHGALLNEPAYMHLTPRLIVERLVVQPDGTAPPEQKVYVYDGRAVFIRTNSPDAGGHPMFGDVHTRDWTWLPIAWERPYHPVRPPRPARLMEILTLAERLGAGLSHCRVDFYDRDDAPLVGEITLYSQSGLVVYPDPAYRFHPGRAMDDPLAHAARNLDCRRPALGNPPARCHCELATVRRGRPALDETAVPRVMAGAGRPPTTSTLAALQDVGGRPAPAMTRGDRCAPRNDTYHRPTHCVLPRASRRTSPG